MLAVNSADEQPTWPINDLGRDFNQCVVAPKSLYLLEIDAMFALVFCASDWIVFEAHYMRLSRLYGIEKV